MRPLSAAELLDLWDRGADQHPIDRALAILAAGCPERSMHELATLSLGERDALITALRIQTMGRFAQGQAECPHCLEHLEFPVPAESVAAGAGVSSGGEPMPIRVDGMDLTVRALCSYDLAAAANCETVADARRVLARRAVVSGVPDGASVDDVRLSTEAEECISSLMAELDPAAEVLIALTCPTCASPFEAPFDPAAFFWSEIAAEARRLLYEVGVLARNLNWSQADILNMSSRRRAAYLDMVTG